MNKFLKFIRIVCMVILCILVLLSVCVLPSFLEVTPPAESSASSPESSFESTPTPETPPPQKDYVTVDGEALDIVDASKNKYSYSEMVVDLGLLAEKYPDKMSYSAVGNSLDGRNIYAVTLGNPNADKQIIISAGIHGREYLTPMLVMKQLEFYLYNYDTAQYGGTPLSDIFEEYSFCILPMCNPDGITLAQFGLDSINSESLKSTIRDVYASDSARGYVNDPLDKYLTYWKANARGVDLNRNFDTRDWDSVSSAKQPCHKNYKGASPLSEPESKAMADYVSSLSNPTLALAVHSQGEIIYFDCGQDNIHPSLNLAKSANEVCGYKVIYDTRRDAAFEDWCVINKNIPSVTIETGNYTVTEPIPEGEFDKIWQKNRDMWAHVAVKYME